jgi:ankyrin repeat protein
VYQWSYAKRDALGRLLRALQTGWNAYMFAAAGGHRTVLEFLYSKRAKSEIVDAVRGQRVVRLRVSGVCTTQSGVCVLYSCFEKGFACWTCCVYVAQQGRTALYLAAEKGHTDALKFLVTKTPDYMQADRQVQILCCV